MESTDASVVASSDDPYVTLERAEYLARCWGSRFVSVGVAGHINSESGLKDWAQGKVHLRGLLTA